MRIDDLAQRSGISVDTIRFWQKNGLLEPPSRVGRTAHYAESHLRRLGQIRDLQARHLSLAAIKHLLDASRGGLAETLWASDGGDHTRAQLADESGLDVDLVLELEQVGLLQAPVALGRDSYDDADLHVLQAVRALLDAGLPRTFVVRLGAIYADGFASMQQQVLELFTEPAEGVDIDALQAHLAEAVRELLQPVEVLLEYRHQRAIQTMTLAASVAEERAGSGLESGS